MRKKLQKILAVVMAISMTMSLMTSTAFAASYIDGRDEDGYRYGDGELDKAVAAATSSVTLTSNERLALPSCLRTIMKARIRILIPRTLKLTLRSP